MRARLPARLLWLLLRSGWRMCVPAGGLAAWGDMICQQLLSCVCSCARPFVFITSGCLLAPSGCRPAVARTENSKLRVVSHIGGPMCLRLAHNTRVCGVRVDTAADMQHKVGGCRRAWRQRLLPAIAGR